VLFPQLTKYLLPLFFN